MDPRRNLEPRLTAGLAAALDAAADLPAVRFVSGAARQLIDLLLPSLCTLCGAPAGPVCSDCLPQLNAELLHPFRAEQDAAALPLRQVPPAGAGADRGRPPGPLHPAEPLPVVAAARYGDLAANALLAFKDHGRTPVARILRPAVYRALAAAPGLLGSSGPFTLVPVPGSAAGYRRRGFDPVEELLAGPLPPGWTVGRGALVHRRVPPWAPGPSRASHAGSGSRQRRSGSRDRFRATRRMSSAIPTAARNGPVGGPGGVVLFDDVMTTGSTLAATYRALGRAGIIPVGAVVLAAVTAPGPGSEEGLNSR